MSVIGCNGNNDLAVNMSVSTEEDVINAMLLELMIRMSSLSLMSLENANRVLSSDISSPQTHKDSKNYNNK